MISSAEVLAEEHEAAAVDHAEPAEQEIAAVAISAPKPPEYTPESIAGFFFGRILSIDSKRRFVYARSVDSQSIRKLFYLDRRTQFREKKKRIRFATFEPGDQIAIRFFARGDTAIADALFLVKGEFNMKDYRVVAAKKPEAAGAAAGGHGAKPAAEKPAAAKPSGGGH